LRKNYRNLFLDFSGLVKIKNILINKKIPFDDKKESFIGDIKCLDGDL